jgi:tRNA C32,U32 (ribose-2'-O)-methylase TrmJ
LHPAAPAELIDAQVIGDAIEPSVKARRALKAAEVSMDLDKGLLADVQGVLAVVEHAEREGVDAPLIALNELTKGLLVAALAALDQALVFDLIIALPPFFGCWV